MKLYELHRRQVISRPRDEVFAYFNQPENLGQIARNDIGFTILTPSPITMQSGATLDYTIRIGLLNVRWTTLISNHNPPHSFSDVALRSPYSFWHHTHAFEEVGDWTITTDTVR